MVALGRKLVKTIGHPGINRPIAFIFISWATIPNFYDAQFNFLTETDNMGWKGDYENGNFADAADFGFETSANITCAWLAEHDPGCSGQWMDALKGEVTTI